MIIVPYFPRLKITCAVTFRSARGLRGLLQTGRTAPDTGPLCSTENPLSRRAPRGLGSRLD